MVQTISIFRKTFSVLFVFFLAVLGLTLGDIAARTSSANAEQFQKLGRETGLPLPRFVSLKAKAVNLRVGPGRKYGISWLYKKRGLPVEVIQEFDQWRRIRDSEGTTGWVLHSLLSSKRTALVAPWEKAEPLEGQSQEAAFFDARNSASDESSTIARVQAGLLVRVEECDKGWCAIEAQSTRAWMKQETLWGVYPNELVDG